MEPKIIKSTSLEKKNPKFDQYQQGASKKDGKSNTRLRKHGKIILGVCAVKKKVQSKPMREILSRMKCKQIEIIEMWQYLDNHWSTWPKVDALICFYSDGFPFLMAWKYVKKHNPFLINNLEKQQLLWDRTIVYDILKKIKIPVAQHYYIIRQMDYLQKIESKSFGRKYPQSIGESKIIQELLNPDLSGKTKSSEVSSKDNEFKSVSTKKLALSSKDIDHQTDKTQIQHQNNFVRKIKDFQVHKSKNHNYSKDSAGSISKNSSSNFEYEEGAAIYPNILKRYSQNRSNSLKKYQVEEGEDCIYIRHGQKVKKLTKPFVQKPFDAQNHEICVYYPVSMGGGRKKLFRKVKDQSSLYQNINQIRKDGNYIYEQFLPTNAFDIKVYTIGPYYMYAQARKSPTLDGVVQRNAEGKQFRFPVILTPDEKFICNRIVQQFGQEVCGFDLLRANGKSYVCDVNGWSFVKSNPKYWEDCAIILKKKILNHFFPGDLHHNLRYLPQKQQLDEYKEKNSIAPKFEQLRSIVSIFRHGDRSPKLKLKIKTSDYRFIQFFDDTDKQQLKFKNAQYLTKILQITIMVIAELSEDDPALKDYLQMKIVLQSGGHFDGLNRKLQLKVLSRAQSNNEIKGKVKKVQIILKWGGQLSHVGYQDAIMLGQKMRMERYDDHDCLSLYSSYRHDVKTYASDEGRCIKTAAAFLKGFLSIEGELAPIISSMVRADLKAQRLLDCTSSQNHSPLEDQIRIRLSQLLNSKEDLASIYQDYCGETTVSDIMKDLITKIGRPWYCMQELYKHLTCLSEEIQRIFEEKWQNDYSNDRKSNYDDLSLEEKCDDILLINSRWAKLKKELFDQTTQIFNISKIPDIYDTIRYDLRKNRQIFDQINITVLENLQKTAKLLAQFVVINEYGICDSEKLKIALDICIPLLDKILIDLMFWKQKSSQDKFWKFRNNVQVDKQRHIRTRLYFTSASHMYSLINILKLGNNQQLLRKTPPLQAEKINNILYMGYLSHIEFRLYENLRMEESDPNRFRLQISLSTQYKKEKEMKQFSLGGSGLTINEMSKFFYNFLKKSNVHVDENAQQVLARQQKKQSPENYTQKTSASDKKINTSQFSAHEISNYS